MAGSKEKVTVDLTTSIGVLSFPRLTAATAQTKDDGTKSYDIQIIIPKSDRDGARAILRAIKTVGEAKWGANWKKVRTPLRDGDREKDDLAEDGTTKGEKYPERLNSYFLNARSTKPVGVFDRQRAPLTEADAIYGGCKGKIAVTFYPYSNNGNHGVGCALNGVQKIADGEPFGGSRPTVESMFDMLDDDDDLGLEDDDLGEDEDMIEEEPAPPKRPAKKAAAKKAAPAKKAAAKKAAAKVVEEPEEDEEDDLLEDIEEDEDDLYADLDDEDDSDL